MYTTSETCEVIGVVVVTELESTLVPIVIFSPVNLLPVTFRLQFVEMTSPSIKLLLKVTIFALE